MRKLISIACAVLMACACYAEPRAYVLKTAMGAGTGATNTLTGLRGFVEEIQVLASDASSTGTVFIAYLPLDVSATAINIATGSVAAIKIWRPALDRTDIAGADLTGDPPARIMLTGESLRMIVAGSPTNKTWKATIKLDR